MYTILRLPCRKISRGPALKEHTDKTSRNDTAYKNKYHVWLGVISALEGDRSKPREGESSEGD